MYVERDGNGKIVGAYAQPQRGRAEESLMDDNAELIAFLIRPPSTVTAQEQLASFTELGFITGPLTT